MSHSILCPIVGMRFRPPAKAILDNLPAWTEMKLVREPENPYDEFAVQVLIRSSQIPESRYPMLEQAAEGFGFTLDDILGIAEWHLGFIDSKKTGCARKVSTLLAVDPSYKAILEFDASGQPNVNVEFPE